MDDLLLDAETLFSTADIVDHYCARQRETINVYYAQIMALESEWEDDETFGGIVEEIKQLRNHILAVIEQVHMIYPKYFRERAQRILGRPTFQGRMPDPIIISYPAQINMQQNFYSNATGTKLGDAENTPKHISFTYLGGNPSETKTNIVPRQLDKTKETMHTVSPGVSVFDSPSETAQHMILRQGHVEGWEDYNGNCGLCSVGNCARLSGIDMSEGNVIRLAVYNKSGDKIVPLCDTTGDSNNQNKGGTSPIGRKQLLSKLGIESQLVEPSIKDLANAVCQGKGCIISVHADILWYGARQYAKNNNGEIKINPTTGFPEFRHDGHAVLVTSVKIENGKVVAFSVADSGRQNGDHGEDWYSADLIQKAFTGNSMNITKKALR